MILIGVFVPLGIFDFLLWSRKWNQLMFCRLRVVMFFSEKQFSLQIAIRYLSNNNSYIYTFLYFTRYLKHFPCLANITNSLN